MNASNQKAGQDPKRIPTTQEMESWDNEQLLEWIKNIQPKIFRDNNDVLTFKAAKISGSAFMEYAEDLDFFREIHLPLGVYGALASLAKKVKKQNDQSDQTAGQKRKGIADAPEEPPISPKRYRIEESMSNLAIAARERRKHVKDAITDIKCSADQLSNSVEPLKVVDRLSDPAFDRVLPFPFLLSIPNRFKGSKGHWRYVGRTKFKQLVKTLDEVRCYDRYMSVWLYGTQGYGKSHLLAALVCYLTAQDERVVYIPDCRSLLVDPIVYIKTAMLFAWADDVIIQKEIPPLNTTDQIKAFISSQENVIFVIDQMNAFKTTDPHEPEIRNLHNWVKSFTLRHKAIFSSSANYTEYLKAFQKQSSHRVLRVDGGLDDTEMHQWWERHKDLEMEDCDPEKFEDITGRIPLLLDNCVVTGKINLKRSELRDIRNQSVGFVQDVRRITKEDNDTWKWYCDYVTACFLNETVPSGSSGHLDLIDHRYFYHNDEETGGYTCGLVREAVADQLLVESRNFLNTNFLGSLRNFVNSRSMIRFIIEYAVLAVIQRDGLFICERSKDGMRLKLFVNSSSIDTDITNEWVLYRPLNYDNKAIDGIIVRIDTKKKKKYAKGERPILSLYPIQITVADSHSDSHATFLKEYRQWIMEQSKFDVRLEFLWITPRRLNGKEHPATSTWPKHLERFVHLEDVSEKIWDKYQIVTENA
ncbi:uncharacterized protein Z518_11304 [Rhinocladiella mackenziei CBS 650.93]|uniref:Rhinocladiella mackenziei CBS 650.93 unplaced genomic scaffold supercont1.12, whole genome shotgun sequence n=1 Tax=Rhinocladiella mackenziei CBS 650.93 TaxID=1442369 RepID=A0A0D2I8M5_9EURO|nr:uncharacterized protein Z518_11304 [Rhinocladiella mackenziei CBS 650.93]KIW99565.1 hypothetical protein Z518_11304 [Rhinocladiella mackenziei CBS 650.93]